MEGVASFKLKTWIKSEYCENVIVFDVHLMGSDGGEIGGAICGTLIFKY